MLDIIMVAIVLLVIGITCTLYSASFEQQRMRLTELTKYQAGLISAMGDHKNVHLDNTIAKSAVCTTLSQIVQAHKSINKLLLSAIGLPVLKSK